MTAAIATSRSTCGPVDQKPETSGGMRVLDGMRPPLRKEPLKA